MSPDARVKYRRARAVREWLEADLARLECEGADEAELVEAEEAWWEAFRVEHEADEEAHREV